MESVERKFEGDSPVSKISGMVERVTFHSEQSGFCVLQIKVRGFRELVTLTGFVSEINAGEMAEAQGLWVQHKEYGRQFKAETLRTVPPTTLEGIEKYLGSGMVKGIGPAFAKRLVEAFGERVFEVIESSPQRLRTVSGIGAKRVAQITEAWENQKVIREIIVFLQSHGVSSKKATRIFKTYGQRSVEVVRENPYRLAKDIYGIGFKSADQIAEKLGIEKNSLKRARAGIAYALQERIQEGHCCYPERSLIEKAEELLEIEGTILKEALEQEIAEGDLFPECLGEERFIYPASLFQYEKEIADRIASLTKHPPAWGKIDVDAAVAWVERVLLFELAPLQKEAVKQALGSKVSVITGGPGTGKTTLTLAILKILRAKGVRVALCSPTGRAAKRLSECTGLEAVTIHRLLRFDFKKGGFVYNRENPLATDLLLIDEMSMVDVPLFFHLLRALPPSASLLLVGDQDQLPSVGPGQVLRDIIASEKLSTVKLNQIFRQASQSEIVRVAHQINQGEYPDLKAKPNSDLYFLEISDPEQGVSDLVNLVQKRLPKRYGFDSVADIQVLSPMQRGLMGARNLNLALQQALNPHPKNWVERFGYRFGVGDKVMVTLNDYDKEVYNGDIGYVVRIDSEDQVCEIDFEGRAVEFGFDELDILVPAYTITIHKSQGSEYPAVVLPIVTQHYVMLKRNLLYTGVTRGKRLVVILGQKKAIAIAIRSLGQGARYGFLANRIRAINE